MIEKSVVVDKNDSGQQLSLALFPRRYHDDGKMLTQCKPGMGKVEIKNIVVLLFMKLFEYILDGDIISEQQKFFIE